MSQILMIYEKASGQTLNLNRSEIFCHNTAHNHRELLANILGVMECLSIGWYLGMPSLVGWKKDDFNFIRKGYGKKFSHGIGVTHLRLEKRWWLRLFYSQFLPISWVFSSFLSPRGGKSNKWWIHFGGGCQEGWKRYQLVTLGEANCGQRQGRHGLPKIFMV